MIIENETRIIAGDLWSQEIQDGSILDSTWPTGIVFPGFTHPWWTFQSFQSQPWEEGEYAAMKAVLQEQKAGPGWRFRKLETRYMAVYQNSRFQCSSFQEESLDDLLTHLSRYITVQKAIGLLCQLV